MITWLKKAALLTSALVLAACGGGDEHPGNVVQVAQGDARFGILVEAVTAADLAGALSGPGPLTVLAPTDAAFTALLAELGLTKAQLLADKALLGAVLKYHVLPTRVAKAEVALGQAIAPLEGGILKIDQVGAELVVTDGRNRTAKVVAADLPAANGVIHGIDKVLLPANRNLVETAVATPGFSILVEAVVAANLAGTLSGPGPYTVLAPTDAAFAALLGELGLTKAQLLANTALLSKVLTYHVLPARVLKAGVPVGSPIASVQGESFTVNAQLAVTDRRGRIANITATDVLASNGVIHVLDKVLLPAP